MPCWQWPEKGGRGGVFRDLIRLKVQLSSPRAWRSHGLLLQRRLTTIRGYLQASIETFPFPISAFPELETGICKQSELELLANRSVLLVQAITGYSMSEPVFKVWILDPHFC